MAHESHSKRRMRMGTGRRTDLGISTGQAFQGLLDDSLASDIATRAGLDMAKEGKFRLMIGFTSYG